ncbi:major facilitator superfamily protein [Hirsutella rhossiliensis]|uniref:Major facilitator superfamily domain-containing protein n=1 Tax=Hirsutella rhossiliensis TaxID=111463 RepID=A0A9P8SJZ4_9HYPO|nr:major facilitator superfamily domain-containing protein [Hirsutella rhossiliensis]KAH0964699.1 major facilitator superfamily domain-containing protein [Hirsutella rhossiliensis]
MENGRTSSDGGEKLQAILAHDDDGPVHEKAADESSHVDDDDSMTPDEQRRIIRRVDRRLVLTVGALYCVSLMDRTNMSAANIAGMSTELHLQGYRYNIANLVFFIPYVLFQPPSTILVRRIGPRLHLAGVILFWGAVMIGMGFVSSFGQLAGLRAVLGCLEAGFFPSCVYLLSTWYTRYEVGKRYSVFYLLGCVASACSGILAYGLMQLRGREGLSGWRWIFIIEGALTCALAIASYWLLVDFPDSHRKSWKFLGARERQWVVNRIQRDRGDTQVSPFNLKTFLGAGRDWKVWAYALIFFNTTTITYALAYTLPIILVGNLGFDVGAAQCLVAPPYAFAGIVMFTTGYVGDKYHVRGPVILVNMLLCLIGLPIMGWHPNAAVRYLGVFFVTAGANSNVPAMLSFQANNVRGQWKRAFCSATLVGFGGIGGIAGSLVFRDQDKATGYKPGMYACIACSLLNVVLVLLLNLEFYRQNRLADQGKKTLESDEDDGSKDFRYTC